MSETKSIQADMSFGKDTQNTPSLHYCKLLGLSIKGPLVLEYLLKESSLKGHIRLG